MVEQVRLFLVTTNWFSLGKRLASDESTQLIFVLFLRHADGSIKFWDASGCNLVFLYKLRTNRLFDRIQPSGAVSPPSAAAASSNTTVSKEINSNVKFDTKSTRTNSNTNEEQQQQQQMLLNDDTPFSIYSIKICCEGKYLLAAARGGHATLFKFTGSELEKADEGLGDLACLEIPIYHRNVSNDHEVLNNSGTSSIINDLQSITIKQNLERKVSLKRSLHSNACACCLGTEEFAQS